MPAPPPNLLPFAVGSVFLWQVYRRVRRHIGRQRLQPKRMMVRIAIFAVLILVFGVISALRPSLLIGFGGGLAVSVPLALIGLRLTRFETTPEGSFYTPNTYIGVALSVLLVVRLVYRINSLYGTTYAVSTPQPALMQSSLTLFLFGLLSGYSITYYSGIFLRSREPRLVSNQ
jgi:hypothetical protein